MAFQIAKATKTKAKLRLAVFGPSGAGKTFTSLRIASGLGGTVGVIDTEKGSASKYADRFDFLTGELTDRSVNGYTEAIHAMAGAGVNVLVIDSLSHGWQELVAAVEKIAKARYKGNTWSAWSEGTPMQRRLVEAILDYPGHVIATMRSKTEWQAETDGGKSRPVRVGLAPEQGKGIEYEFDVLLEMSVDHQGTILKDRTGKYQDLIIDRPGEDFGRDLAAWLDQGAEAPRGAAPANPPANSNGRPAVPEPLGDLIGRRVEHYNGLWAADAPGAPPLVPHANSVMHHFVSGGLANGTIRPDEVSKPGSEARDDAKCWRALEGLYRRSPTRFAKALDDYLDSKLDDARAELAPEAAR